MSERPTQPTRPELFDSEVSQIITFRKFYKAAFFRGVSSDWEGPLGQAATIALELSDTHPNLLIQVGYLNELLDLRELQALGIETDETEESLRESFGFQ